MGKQYDVGLVFGIQPDPTTQMFPFVLKEALRTAVLSYRNRRFGPIIVSGKYARQHDDVNDEAPWYETEAQWMKRYLLDLGYPGHNIITEPESTETIPNIIMSGRIIESIGGVRTVLQIGPSSRKHRIQSLSAQLLSDVAQVTYVAIPDRIDPWTEQKEPFTEAIERRLLATVPYGSAGWQQAERLQRDLCKTFWPAFDAAHRELMATKNAPITPLDCMQHMNTSGLSQRLVRYAYAVADLVPATFSQ